MPKNKGLFVFPKFHCHVNVNKFLVQNRPTAFQNSYTNKTMPFIR